MNRQAFRIGDGRMVTPHPHHPDVWMLDGSRVAVELADGHAVVVDELGRQVHRGLVRHRKSRTASKSTADVDHSRRDAASRFATLNTFVDQVMRKLSPVESLVWLVAFRDCRNGQSSTSSSDLATRTGCSVRAVKTAVKKLCKAGLMTPVVISRHKGQASIYAVATQPHLCGEKLAPRQRRQRKPTGATAAPVGSGTG